MHYDVFISRKDEDSGLARVLYEYLVGQGLTVFEANLTLPEIGVSDFTSAIDQAIESSDHMILLASKTSFLTSTWVQSEWKMYESEFRSSNKKGNLVLVLKKPFDIKQLPIALRSKQVIEYSKTSFPQLLKYLKTSDTPTKPIAIPKLAEPHKTKSNRATYYIGAAVVAIILLMIGLKKWNLQQKSSGIENMAVQENISHARQFHERLQNIEKLTESDKIVFRASVLELIDSPTTSRSTKDSLADFINQWQVDAENAALKNEWILKLKPPIQTINKPIQIKKIEKQVKNKNQAPPNQNHDEIYYYKDPEVKNE